MKTVISIGSIILCLLVLVIGQIHWMEKTNVSAKQSEEKNTLSVENDQGVSKVTSSEMDSILSYTKNWPAESVATLKANLEAGKPFKMAFLGSTSQGEGEESWPSIVTAALSDKFGGHITVSTFSYDLTSSGFVQENKVTEVINEQPDLILFEPFTLKDNGVIATEDSLENTSTIIAKVKESLPNTVVMIQPPHPLYKATFYPAQVEELQKYAEDNGIPYLNHWEAWPDPTTEKIKPYLVEDSTQPSPEGHKLWADYLIKYFIAE